MKLGAKVTKRHVGAAIHVVNR